MAPVTPAAKAAHHRTISEIKHDLAHAETPVAREAYRSELARARGAELRQAEGAGPHRVEYDFTDFPDDSGARQHEIEPATADEVEADLDNALALFFAEFTAPQFERRAL